MLYHTILYHTIPYYTRAYHTIYPIGMIMGSFQSILGYIGVCWPGILGHLASVGSSSSGPNDDINIRS